MPEREFIHSTADVASALRFALDSGLQVRLDVPEPEPRPYLLDRSDVGEITRGVFFLFRPEWVYGPPQILPISSGHYVGKFSVSPRTNTAEIDLYFNGERIDRGRRRLGSGAISFHRDWLQLPAKLVKATPPDVEKWFKRIAAHLFTQAMIKVGKHKYHICRGVTSDPDAPQCLPPFDFIPWYGGEDKS